MKQLVGEENFITFILVLYSIFLGGFLLRCFVGFSARAEGKGKRKSVVYLVFAGLITLVFLFIIIVEIYYLAVYRRSIFSMTVSLIIDITSLVFLVELIVNSIKIRKLRKVVSE